MPPYSDLCYCDVELDNVYGHETDLHVLTHFYTLYFARDVYQCIRGFCSLILHSLVAPGVLLLCDDFTT